jgi:dynein heavy chain
LLLLLQVPPYVNFLRPNMEVPPYEPVRDLGALKDTLTEKLEDYALEPGAKPLDLVLFK